MTLIRYGGNVAVLAGATRAYLAPALEDRGEDDPVVRFVFAMSLYADAVQRGEMPGPYSDARAEAFARMLLMPDDAFRRLTAARHGDEAVAAHFNVPVEQVRAKRADLRPSGRRPQHPRVPVLSGVQANVPAPPTGT